LEIGAAIGGTKICFHAVITTTVRNGPMVTTVTVITSPIDLMHTHDRKNEDAKCQPELAEAARHADARDAGTAKALTLDEARHIASNIAKLPQDVLSLAHQSKRAGI